MEYTYSMTWWDAALGSEITLPLYGVFAVDEAMRLARDHAEAHDTIVELDTPRRRIAFLSPDGVEHV